MAVMMRLHMHGTREQHDALDLKVTSSFKERGGPPAGLLVHAACPEGDGFLMYDIWRSEAEATAFHADTMLPAVAELGIAVDELTATPVWGLARP